MAKVWIVMVLLLAQNVFADNEDINRSCDACIRSGKLWCHKKTEQNDKHCIADTTDNACRSEDVEQLVTISNRTDGITVTPTFEEKTLFMSDTDPRRVSITYSSAKEKKVFLDFLNTTNPDLRIDVRVDKHVCKGTECSIIILAKPLAEFCTYSTYIDVNVKVQGIEEQAKIRYHVPCSCECTKKTQINSTVCHNHGNYTCGICSCESDWTGDRCEHSCISRGDLDTTCETDKHDRLMDCYGNGICACGECKCFDDKDGYQYFEPSEKCIDVCYQTVRDYHSCLRNGTLGDCGDSFNVMELNETIVATDVDEKMRNKWVHCQESADQCNFDYYTMKTEEKLYVMIKSSCNTIIAVKQNSDPASTKVPLILGILGIIAVLATVGGIMLWKHMNALPALPLTDPQYANIDAEDCTGENPLYKPPTSSFKNPTYGKW